MNVNHCKGCDHCREVPQWIFFDETGMRRLAVPYQVSKPYCGAYGLHLEWVKRLAEIRDNGGACPRYLKDGVS